MGGRQNTSEKPVQLSNLFRRGIVRGIDNAAAHQLAFGWIESPVRVEWLPIPTDAFFETLWEHGIFQKINAACGISISDYAEVTLPLDKIAAALTFLRKSNVLEEQVQEFCQNLVGLLESALAAKRDVVFVF